MRWIRSLLLACALFAGISPAFAEAVNINEADVTALATAMDGVGPKKAQAIVAYRKKHGPFGSLDELMAVKGIGEKTIEANRNSVFVGGAGKGNR